MKFEKVRRGWLNLSAAIEVYFIWAAMLAFVLGVALAEAWRPAVLPDGLLPACLLAAPVLLLLALFRRRLFWLLPAFLLVGLLWSVLAQARMYSFAVAPDEAALFSGRVVEVMENTDPLNDDCSFVMQGQDQNGWQGRLLVYGSAVRPLVGDRLEICGLVQQTLTDFKTTYNFGLRSNPYLYSQAAAASLRPAAGEISLTGLAAAYSPVNLAAALRARLFAAMEPLPERQKALLKGIGFGERGFLTNGQSGVLSQTGIIHIFAVSGLHISYVAMLGGLLLRRFKLPVWLHLALVSVLISFFALLAGLTPSVLRAVIMSLLGGWTVWLNDARTDRRASLCGLLLAAFLLLLWRPGWVWQPGFLLSFLATAGIVCTAGLWRRLAPLDLLSVSLAAQFMIMPLAAYFFNTVSLVGLLLAPFLACAAGWVLLLLLAAVALLPFNLAYAALAGAGFLADLLYQGAELLSGLPLAFSYTLRPGWLSLALYYLLLAAALWFLARIKRQ